jgi:hypothetical protein
MGKDAMLDCRKRVDWRVVSILLAAAATVLTACGWYSFWESRAPERSFMPEDLLIDQDIVPSGWELTGPHFPTGDDLCTRQCATIGFKAAGDQSSIEYGGHDVYGYLSTGIARRTFDHVYLRKAAYLHSQDEWTYLSPLAEQSYFGCGNMAGNVGVYCQWGGQYEEYIVVFGARVPPGEVTLENIELMEQMVRAIDDRMAQYLGKPVDDSGDQGKN